MTFISKWALAFVFCGLVLPAFVFAAGKPTDAAKDDAKDVPKTEAIQFPAGKDTVGGTIAEPATPGRHPAVIVIHAWWGLNDWIKEQTQKLADQGFVALAVDLYAGHVATEASTAMDLRMGLKDEVAVRDLQAAFDYLMTRKDVDRDHIGAIGWDMGGGYALKL